MGLGDTLHASWRLTPTGVRWRYFEVLRGRFLEVFLAGVVLLLVNYVIVSLIQVGARALFGELAELLDWSSGLAFGDEYELAIAATGTLFAAAALFALIVAVQPLLALAG